MPLAELLPRLRELNRAEKLRAMQFLVAELVNEEAHLLTPGRAYPVWSPHDASEAASAMLEVLRTTQDDRA